MLEVKKLGGETFENGSERENDYVEERQIQRSECGDARQMRRVSIRRRK